MKLFVIRRSDCCPAICRIIPLERVCSVRFLIDQGKMRDLVSLEVNKTLHGNSCVDTYYYMRALHEYGNRFNPSGTIA